MEEYRIDIKVRNNLILKKIEKAGYSSIGELCRLNDMKNATSRLCEIINMKASPLNSKGEFFGYIEKFCDILGCAPYDLFTDTQLNNILETNRRSIQVNEAEMKFMLQNDNSKLLEDSVLDIQKKNQLEKQLSTLTMREQKLLEMRFAMNNYSKEHTLEECAKEFGISRERIRQLEKKALKKLRHPRRADHLRDFRIIKKPARCGLTRK